MRRPLPVTVRSSPAGSERPAVASPWYPRDVWPAPVWIRTADEAEALARELHGVPAVAIDTEADSLHHYPERLCLIQLADPDGRVFFLDTLVLLDLEPLRPLFADPATMKVFHSGDNDVVYLKRRFGLAFAGLSDTMLAARFLGVRELGLERLLLKYLDVQPVRSQQKTDWARRPLTPTQEHYAAEDVRHLIVLRERLARRAARDRPRELARGGVRGAGRPSRPRAALRRGRLPADPRAPRDSRRAGWPSFASSISSARRGRARSTGRRSRS